MEKQTIVVNDLLSFLWCKVDVVSRETLLICVESFYSEDFAYEALQSLLSALPMEIKQSNLDGNPFIAMLDIIEQSPKDTLPTFVCRNLNNIPDIRNLSNKTVTREFDCSGIYREHERLIEDLKRLNKSISDLSKRLRNFSKERTVLVKNEHVELIIDQHDVSENYLKTFSELETTKTEAEERCPNTIEVLQEYEDLQVGLIANRYQRTLARRVENGKSLEVKKIKPILIDPYEISRSVSNSIVSSSPFYKIEHSFLEGPSEEMEFQTKTFKTNDSSSSCSIIKSVDEDMVYEEELEPYKGTEDEDDPEPVSDNGTKENRRNSTGIGTFFRCPYCTKPFNRYDWIKHVRECQGVNGTINPFDYHCKKCDLFFATKKVLGFHMGLHDKARPFECSKCKYRFYTQKSVNSHMKMHVVDFRHKCPFCYFQAYKLSRVKEHIRSHTGERPFQCSMCDYSTTSYTTLIRGHMHCHSDVRAFKCSHCDKCYKTKGKLQLHLRSHSTEKQYECSVCGKGFNKSYQLTIHYKCHLTEKSYACSRCDYTTKDTSVLRKHMKGCLM